MELTKKQDIKRDETFVAYDICDCTNYECTALKDAEDEVVKTEFDDSYIIYAQWWDDDPEDRGIEGYWVIDTGDCH